MLKKEIARSFLQLAASGNVVEAYSRYVDHHFIHHNQYFKGDRESLLKAMSEGHTTNPNKKFEVKQIFEDGDFVITHSLVLRSDEQLAPIAVVHIFRISENRIVEMWDLGQEVSKNSPNLNGPF